MLITERRCSQPNDPANLRARMETSFTPGSKLERQKSKSGSKALAKSSRKTAVDDVSALPSDLRMVNVLCGKSIGRIKTSESRTRACNRKLDQLFPVGLDRAFL